MKDTAKRMRSANQVLRFCQSFRVGKVAKGFEPFESREHILCTLKPGLFNVNETELPVVQQFFSQILKKTCKKTFDSWMSPSWFSSNLWLEIARGKTSSLAQQDSNLLELLINMPWKKNDGLTAWSLIQYCRCIEKAWNMSTNNEITSIASLRVSAEVLASKYFQAILLYPCAWDSWNMYLKALESRQWILKLFSHKLLSWRHVHADLSIEALHPSVDHAQLLQCRGRLYPVCLTRWRQQECIHGTWGQHDSNDICWLLKN